MQFNKDKRKEEFIIRTTPGIKLYVCRPCERTLILLKVTIHTPARVLRNIIITKKKYNWGYNLIFSQGGSYFIQVEQYWAK